MTPTNSATDAVVEEVARAKEKAKRRKAYSQLRQALLSGRVKRPEQCEGCNRIPERAKDGRTRIQGHHYKGYDFPLDVQWLCTTCHGEEGIYPHGIANLQHKLTEKDVREIKRSPLGAKLLSRRYGVSDTSIKLIRRGITWAWVDPMTPTMKSE